MLPYVSIYLPIRRLLALFCSTKASPTEPQELSFIQALIANLSRRPELLTLFAHQVMRVVVKKDHHDPWHRPLHSYMDRNEHF